MNTSYRARLGIVPIFSQYHIQSAVFHAGEAKKILELYKKDRTKMGLISPLRSYVTSSIFHSVAFMEARINELLVNAKNGLSPWDKDKKDTYFAKLERTIKISGLERLTTLDKYQIVLELLSMPQFETNERIYQDVDLLRRIRNKLIHFEPDRFVYVQPEKPSEEHKLLRALKGKFELNIIADDMGRRNFPDILLGQGCASWSARSALVFVQNFDQAIELPISNEKILEELET